MYIANPSCSFMNHFGVICTLPLTPLQEWCEYFGKFRKGLSDGCLSIQGIS